MEKIQTADDAIFALRNGVKIYSTVWEADYWIQKLANASGPAIFSPLHPDAPDNYNARGVWWTERHISQHEEAIRDLYMSGHYCYSRKRKTNKLK